MVTKIGDWAFPQQTISEITIPATVTTIGEYAFYACSALKTVTFASGSQLKIIGKNAFSNDGGSFLMLESITIPASVKTIGESAFWCSNSFKTIEFEKGSQLESIGEAAFMDCPALESIIIPASVKSIGNGAFTLCGSLASIIVDSNNSNYSSQDGITFPASSRNIYFAIKPCELLIFVVIIYWLRIRAAKTWSVISRAVLWTVC